MENTDCIKKIYLVGGAVRDKLLNLPIKDKDYVAVGFSEEEFSHLQKVGKSFPVFLQNDGSQIALARKETKILHGYNGFSVQTDKISLYEDLQRRDLTINSIAFDEETQTYHDPFGGIKDLENKTLRHTSEAFCEDPLRVLRIARFRARFGIAWKIHSSTKILIYKMRKELKFLEPNRIYKELQMLFSKQDSYLFFETLFELGVLDVIFPHIHALSTLKEGNLHHLENSVFAHSMQVLKYAESNLPQDLKNNEKYALILKFAAIYHDIAKPYCYRNFGNAAGHDDKNLILQFLDIALPLQIQKSMLILIQNHIKITMLHTMRPLKCVAFFESFKRDKNLLKLQVALLIADKLGRTSYYDTQYSWDTFQTALLHTFDALNAYSPRDWIMQNNPTPNAIKAKILKEKIKIMQQSPLHDYFKTHNLRN